MESLVCDIPARDEKIRKLFLQWHNTVELVYMNQSPLELKCTKNDKPFLYCLKGLGQQIDFKFLNKNWQISRSKYRMRLGIWII